MVAIFEILMNLVHDKLGQFSRQKVNDSEVIGVTKVTISTVLKLHMKRLVESGLLASVAVCFLKTHTNDSFAKYIHHYLPLNWGESIIVCKAGCSERTIDRYQTNM